MEAQTYQGDYQTDTDLNSADVSSTLQSVKAHASQSADKLRHAAGDKISQLQKTAGAEALHLKLTAEEYAGQIASYIRAKPVKSAIAAVGLGLILGLLIRR